MQAGVTAEQYAYI